MRRPLRKKHEIKTDPKYDSTLVEKFINSLMWDGKKSTARKVVYDMFEIMEKEKKVEDPLKLFEEAMENISPVMEVRSRRVGGANYQVPREVRPERRRTLAIRWLLQAARSSKGRPMAYILAEEIIGASKKEGAAFKKKEDTHKMAESNKAFAHFAW
ncbi:MAG: 30S ribosomal protein S7 [Candidatus Niyogibacteria bacterium CG10_big_fil_rev_8_21_14_0_10_46_36]|uniref:Small ribosomal subunit protein uS7 n=1 Tax=Candidatus Niyogibacteria bacterium CG10_big_fil_rev_8_21_14_0_10_46_36 TaxID=1974726 RepID=A0A2H0TE03_9BACT|nr:MAG: 30S ribosomal protein S7 [Candidatus Niyogibacteria bacterium CG10_big_fil_rev_8_21_14_0_10_46_36]